MSKLRLTGEIGRRHQPAVEIVGPLVIGAGDAPARDPAGQAQRPRRSRPAAAAAHRGTAACRGAGRRCRRRAARPRGCAAAARSRRARRARGRRPAAASSSARATHSHSRQKMRSFSSANTSAERYQLEGSVGSRPATRGGSCAALMRASAAAHRAARRSCPGRRPARARSGGRCTPRARSRRARAHRRSRSPSGCRRR